MSLLLYIAVFAGASALIYLGTKRKSRPLRTLGVLLPTLLAGLRLDVGTDYANYASMNERIGSLSLAEYNRLPDELSVEFGFFLLTKLTYFMTIEPWLLFFVTSAFTIAVAYLGFRRISVAAAPLAFFLFLLILLPFGLNGIRQGMAVAVMVFAFSYIIKGKPLKYIAAVIFASLFHTSAIMMLPVYFLRFITIKTRLDSNFTLLISVIIAAACVVLVPFMSLLISAIPFLSDYANYTGQGVGVSLFLIALKLVPIILMLLTFRKLTAKYPAMKLMAVLMLLEVATYALGSVSGVFLRLSYYFAPAAFIYLSMAPFAFSPVRRRLLTLITIFYGIGYFVLIYFMAGYSEIFPYNSVLNGGV